MNNSRDIALTALDEAFADQIKIRFGMLNAVGQAAQIRLEHFRAGLKDLIDMRKQAVEIVSGEQIW